MASDQLSASAVDAYLTDLQRSLGPARQASRILEEVEGHLLDAIDRLRFLGRDDKTAAAEAVQAFGPATDVATQMKGIGAMPTTFTRWSGLLGMIGAVAMAAVPIEASSRSTTVDGRDPLLVLPIIGGVLILIGLVGLVARTRDALSGPRLALAGGLIALPLVALGFGLGWGLVGAVMAVMILGGLGVFLERVFRMGALPRPATILLVTAGLALAALAPTDLEKQSPPFYISALALGAGWIWLQYTLWSERSELRL